ncbi:MAG: glycoside hydrolase family 2 TIM barrel-domain containing protein [Thermoanaerobaculia bacterium]|nr:glycoside hydrolase family 2 TIM barrel-domain containing protein [Thermoanaerobaculia bacterium]
MPRTAEASAIAERSPSPLTQILVTLSNLVSRVLDRDPSPEGAARLGHTRAPFLCCDDTGKRHRVNGAVPFLAVSLALSCAACAPDAPSIEPSRPLASDWALASDAVIDADGASLSTPGYDTSGWTEASVPTTVLAALVAAGEYEEPYFGTRLAEIPTERFEVPWWYRTEFDIDDLTASTQLVFRGINYRADVWLNGEQLAAADDLFGAFRMFEIDVTDRVVRGANALAVRVHPPQGGDPTIGFVDWNPTPPDHNMGLWRGVELRRTGAVALDRVFVRSDLDLDTLEDAAVRIEATLRNTTDDAVDTTVAGRIGDAIAFDRPLTLGPGEERTLELGPPDVPQLQIEQPRLWWPVGHGEPELYELDLQVTVGGHPSDRRELTFGIRHVDDYVTEDGYRGYAVNGKKILLRGGGWVDELMLDATPRRLEDQMRYVRHMNLNTIRLEGFWGNSDALYDLADRYGILVMVGWSCQWEWEEYYGAPVGEYGGIDTPEEMEIVTRSLRDQVLWLRNHPSILVWVLASDKLPHPELEPRYLETLADVDATRPALATCAARVSEVSGPSGVKMNGPYAWVPPNYWYEDTERGGAYGFNTETGPGAQPPPIQSIQRMLPEESWWPIDEVWEYHCGRHQFDTLDRYQAALAARYGEPLDLADFARKAQVANFEAMRAMFDAFSIRRPKTTGLIQWMLNSAWPEMYWQLYDHYLVPNGAFYGAMQAARPLHVAFDYGTREIVAVNDTPRERAGGSVRLRLLDLDSRVLLDERRSVDLGAESLLRLGEVPPPTTAGAYFLDLRLLDAAGEELASSLYWLPRRKDVLDWDASTWFYTPTSRYADLTGLAGLPEVELEVEHEITLAPAGHEALVKLHNPTDRLAFFVELRLVGSDSGSLGAPVYWSDNYVSLLPGESRELTAFLPAHALPGETPLLAWDGVNVPGG